MIHKCFEISFKLNVFVRAQIMGKDVYRKTPKDWTY